MSADNKNKMSSVDSALSQIQRQFGKGSIMRLGSRETENIPAVPTGSLSLDIALGVGGLPRGRITEIYGPESSGKDHAGPARYRRGAETGRYRRLHRCRARP